MAIQQFTFPQSGDADDAEFFASLIGQRNLTNYVETGYTFNYNSTVPEVTVSDGKCYINLSQDTASSSGEDVLETNHVVQTPQQTVSLADNDVNYLYVEPDFTTDDNAVVTSYTSQQSGDVLLIGVVDTTADTTEQRNRAPELDARRLSIGDDQPLYLGQGNDFEWYYDSVEDTLALDNDGSTRIADVGDSEWRMEVDVSLQNNNLNSVSTIDGGGTRIQFDDSVELTDQSILFDTDPGAQELVDFPVSSTSPAGTEHSYDFRIDDTELLQLIAESDGAGGIQNVSIDLFAETDLNSNDLVDDTQTIWDASVGEIPDSAFGTIDATSLNLGTGVEDNSGSLRLDEDYSASWTTDQTFQANILDGSSNILYDQSSNEIPRERLDDDKITTLISSSTTTSNEEILFIDTSTGPVTITLASADAIDGNEIAITDVAGQAPTNNITVETEGGETIDGDASVTINAAYGTVQYASDGTNWFSSGGGSGGAFIDTDGDSIGELLTTLDGVQLRDDSTVQFGSDVDYTLEYNSTADRLELVGSSVAIENTVQGNAINMTDVRM